MKKILTSACLLGSLASLAACASTTGSSEVDETLTQAPYAEERTAGGSQGSMSSAEPVFERRNRK